MTTEVAIGFAIAIVLVSASLMVAGALSVTNDEWALVAVGLRLYATASARFLDAKLVDARVAVLQIELVSGSAPSAAGRSILISATTTSGSRVEPIAQQVVLSPDAPPARVKLLVTRPPIAPDAVRIGLFDLRTGEGVGAMTVDVPARHRPRGRRLGERIVQHLGRRKS